jgi:hypothetical protein
MSDMAIIANYDLDVSSFRIAELSRVGTNAQVLTNQCQDVDDEKTNGRRACPAVADAHGLDAGWIAVQPD